MISVIVPAKDEEQALPATLQALRGERRVSREIIVSDGGSTDGTVAIARRLADRVVTAGAGGLVGIAAARNRGTHAATGDFLLFLDADVTVPSADALLGTLEELFRREPDTLAVLVALRVLPDKATLTDRLVSGAVSLLYAFTNNVLHVGTGGGEFLMVRREAFNRVGGFNPAFMAGEDYDLLLRLSRVGRVRFISSLTVFHTGRRAHAIGWTRLLFQWIRNSFYVIFFKRSAVTVWPEIR